MFKNIKIRTRVILIVLISSIISFSIDAVHTYMQMKKMFDYSLNANTDLGLKISNEVNDIIIEQAKNNLQNLANYRAKEINEHFKFVKTEVELIANFLEQAYKNPIYAKVNLPPRISLFSDTSFIKYDLAPGLFMNEKIRNELQKLSELNSLLHIIMRDNKFFNNVHVKTETGILYTNSKYKSIPEYDLRENEWYKKAIENKGRPTWIDDEQDFYGSSVAACSETFFHPNGKIAGTVAIDVKYSDIVEQMMNNNTIANDFEFLIDKKGTYISKNPISPTLSSSDAWSNLQHNISAREYSNRIVSSDSNEYYMFFSRIEENDWIFGLMIPAKKLIAYNEEIKTKISKQIEQTKSLDQTIFSQTLSNLVFVFTLTVFLSVFIAILLSNSITKPLKKLMLQVNNIGKGGLSRIQLKGKDEFAELSQMFNKMSDNLKSYIKELEHANDQTERMNSELEIAHRIQNNLLPYLDADFCHAKELDFYAQMIPAKEVGGDFYDFFYTDASQRKICFLVADVSGKGIPAAIYMAQAKTLIKTNILQMKSLGSAMKSVNEHLSKNNEFCTFITVLAISIDLNSKECIIVNCGHNNPIISLNGKPYEFFKMKNAIAIGMSEKMEYIEQHLKLNSKDKIYLYTDGVVEAMNNKAEFFGNDRLLKCANNNFKAGPMAFDQAIRAEISKFTADTSQSDDITTLSIQIM